MNASPLHLALLSPDPASDYADKLKLYGWLVGQWRFDALAFEPEGRQHRSRGEIHADWVLDGRAVQDVWMIPPRAERRVGMKASDFPVTGLWYGTTLRVYDPASDAWHIHWIDPTKGFHARMIGRASDGGIVQEGTLENGVRLRWSFSNITAEAFRWTGEVSADGGKTWRLQVDIAARRA